MPSGSGYPRNTRWGTFGPRWQIPSGSPIDDRNTVKEVDEVCWRVAQKSSIRIDEGRPILLVREHAVFRTDSRSAAKFM